MKDATEERGPLKGSGWRCLMCRDAVLNLNLTLKPKTVPKPF